MNMKPLFACCSIFLSPALLFSSGYLIYTQSKTQSVRYVYSNKTTILFRHQQHALRKTVQRKKKRSNSKMWSICSYMLWDIIKLLEVHSSKRNRRRYMAMYIEIVMHEMLRGTTSWFAQGKRKRKIRRKNVET